MTSTRPRRAACAAYLAALAAVAVLAGCGSTTTDQSATTPETHHPSEMNGHTAMNSATHTTDMAGGHMPGGHMSDAHGGLASSEDGYRLDLKTPTAKTGLMRVRFAILAPDAKPQTAYAIDQTKRLHFYVVRRDLTNYQHLHPALAADGTWSIALRFTAAGPYRVYTDFVANDAHGTAHPLVLSHALHVTGTYTPATLPKPASSTTVDGYTITLTGAPTAGKPTALTFTITRAGHPVSSLQPYLDTFAHMTALKTGTLAYSHQHPQTPPRSAGHTGPDLKFTAQLPTPGTYRLFLQFKDRGRLHLAQLTVNAS